MVVSGFAMWSKWLPQYGAVFCKAGKRCRFYSRANDIGYALRWGCRAAEFEFEMKKNYCKFDTKVMKWVRVKLARSMRLLNWLFCIYKELPKVVCMYVVFQCSVSTFCLNRKSHWFFSRHVIFYKTGKSSIGIDKLRGIIRFNKNVSRQCLIKTFII